MDCGLSQWMDEMVMCLSRTLLVSCLAAVEDSVAAASALRDLHVLYPVSAALLTACGQLFQMAPVVVTWLEGHDPLSHS